MDVKETQEGYFVMKWKNFITMMISIVVGTNTVTSLVFNQEQNTEQIGYDRERVDRIREHERERNAYILEIHTLKEMIRERDKELNDCN